MLYLSSEVEDLNESYPRGKLRTWAKPPTVLKNRGMPGEMGKPVQIPKVRKKNLKKDKCLHTELPTKNETVKKT